MGAFFALASLMRARVTADELRVHPRGEMHGPGTIARQDRQWTSTAVPYRTDKRGEQEGSDAPEAGIDAL